MGSTDRILKLPSCDCKELEVMDRKTWERLKLQSGNLLYTRYGAPRRNWTLYQDASEHLLAYCGYNRKKKVPDSIRRCLENDNFHSLNNVIDFTGTGVGRYGLKKSDFFKRV